MTSSRMVHMEGLESELVSSENEHGDFQEKANRRKALFISVAFGQLIAFIVAVSALLTKLLVDDHSVSSPALQNSCGYGLTFLAFLVPCGGPHKLREQNKSTVLALFLVAIADSQAAFFGNLAYRFGVSIASVGMLSSFTIPCVMLLSYCFLKVRYHKLHFVGTAIALLGLVFVIAADALGAGKQQASTDASQQTNGTSVADENNSVLGDLLIILGSAFYAVSNVGTEALVKSGSLYQYLVWLGFFGCTISLVQFAIFESSSLPPATGEPLVSLLFILYGCTFALIYFTAGRFLALYDAVVFNLSLLTTDVWGLVFGVLIFAEDIHLLKIVGFLAVVVGVVVYNIQSPTRPDLDVKPQKDQLAREDDMGLQDRIAVDDDEEEQQALSRNVSLEPT